MSHHQPVFSPAGTLLEDRTVGELVAERPNLSRVFQTHGVDFCCQGGRTLRQACERKNVPLATMIADLEEAMATPAEESHNPAQLDAPDLVDYIMERHHGFLRQELPRIYAMSERVARVHGGHTPSLVEVFQVFSELAEELTSHTEKEEEVLFPAIVRLCEGAAAPMPLAPSVTRMMEEHEETGIALSRLRELTNGFTPPPEACNTYRALFAGLAELEEDVQAHIHLENNVLFPTALQRQGDLAKP